MTLSNCPSCGAMMPKGQKFCGECGASMSAAAKRRDPSEPPGTPSPAPAREGPLPFVGRDAELGKLFELRDAAAASLVAATLSGQAGAGKTRLLDEFLHHSKQWRDVAVFVGPDPWWVQRGYHALRCAVRDLAELPEDGGGPAKWPGASPETRAGLNFIFDREVNNKPKERRRRWSATPPMGPNDNSRRLLVAEALRWALGRAQERAKDGRVILAVDDLHAVDGASRNAFADIVADPPLAPVLLLGAHRPSHDPKWEGAKIVEVRGLPTTVAVKLLGSSNGEQIAADPETRNDDDSAVKRVSPMYVAQLTHFTDEGGSDPPAKLADLIALRIERLPADARRVLQAVSILGDRTRSAQLVALLPDVAELSRYLNMLEEADFVKVADGVVSVTHPLIRDVTVASTPSEVKKRLHAKARGDFGVDGDPIPLEAEALHAYLAGESFEALMLLERCAEDARARDDLDGTIDALHKALELARHEMRRGEIDDPVAAMLMFSCKLGDALAAHGQQTDAEGVLTEALDLAGPLSPERSRILASLANVARGAGRADTAFEHMDEALRIAEKTDHRELVDMLERTRDRWFQGL